MKRVLHWLIEPHFSLLALVAIIAVVDGWDAFVKAQHWNGWLGTAIWTGACALLVLVVWLIPPRGLGNRNRTPRKETQ